MRATLLLLGTLALVGMTPASATANPYFPGYRYPCIPQAPDACGPGFYVICPDGLPWGPNYNLVPPWQPFNGARPDLRSCPPRFQVNPFLRSPRDFFMVDVP